MVFHLHVNCIWCLHVWDTHRLARHFRRPADHSPLLLPPPPYRSLPRTHWPTSAWDVSNTALGVMSVQQLEPVNDSRWTLVSLKWGIRVRGVISSGSGSTRAAVTSCCGCCGSPWMKQRVAFKPTHCSRPLCAFCYIILSFYNLRP